MEVNQQTITHLAKLSNFALTDEQSQHLETDIRAILDYISQLDQLNTDGVEPTYQVFEMENVWRPDTIIPQDATPDQLLALTKATQDHQIKVPKVL